jgi:hypothetical protein
MPQFPKTHKQPQPLRDDRKPSNAQSIRSSYRWQKLRNRQRAAFPLCCAPYHEGPLTPAESVHHIKPLETHPHLGLEPTNCIPLCNRCHETADRFDFTGWYDGAYVETEGGVRFQIPKSPRKNGGNQTGEPQP